MPTAGVTVPRTWIPTGVQVVGMTSSNISGLLIMSHRKVGWSTSLYRPMGAMNFPARRVKAWATV